MGRMQVAPGLKRIREELNATQEEIVVFYQMFRSTYSMAERMERSLPKWAEDHYSHMLLAFAKYEGSDKKAMNAEKIIADDQNETLVKTLTYHISSCEHFVQLKEEKLEKMKARYARSVEALPKLDWFATNITEFGQRQSEWVRGRIHHEKDSIKANGASAQALLQFKIDAARTEIASAKALLATLPGQS